MTSLALSSQVPHTSRNTKERAIRGGIFQGQLPNLINIPEVGQETCRKLEISHMSGTIRQIKNEINQLKRNENIIPSHQYVRYFPNNQRDINDRNQRNGEHIQRAPRVPNRNIVVLEEIS